MNVVKQLYKPFHYLLLCLCHYIYIYIYSLLYIVMCGLSIPLYQQCHKMSWDMLLEFLKPNVNQFVFTPNLIARYRHLRY